MPRRIGLKGIAAGMLGSFISRNNDVGGYWAIGKIWLMAKSQGRLGVSINLNSLEMEPSSPEFVPMIQAYRGMLERKMLAGVFDPSWVKSASIEVVFKPECVRGKWYDPPVDEIEFSAKMRIESDLGTQYVVQSKGWCRPHNPRFESKSSRAE